MNFFFQEHNNVLWISNSCRILIIPLHHYNDTNDRLPLLSKILATSLRMRMKYVLYIVGLHIFAVPRKCVERITLSNRPISADQQPRTPSSVSLLPFEMISFFSFTGNIHSFFRFHLTFIVILYALFSTPNPSVCAV